MCSIAVNESIKCMGLESDWEPSCRLATYNGGLLKLLIKVLSQDAICIIFRG